MRSIRGFPNAAGSAGALPGLAMTPSIATGIAAAAALRVPFSAVLFASLLVGSSAAEVAPVAIFAAAVGWIVATALPNPEDRRRAEDEPVPAGVAETGSGPSA